MSQPPSFRAARADDAAAIARLHAESWRAHYRGALADAYLDGPIFDERRALWARRLTHPRAGQVTILAELGPTLIGFVCAFADHDRHFGSLVDNLHVASDCQRSGVGRRLMATVGEALLQGLPQRPLYLFVLESNHRARRFYDTIGGTPAERGRNTEPDGSELVVIRYVWASPAALLARVSDRNVGRDVSRPD